MQGSRPRVTLLRHHSGFLRKEKRWKHCKEPTEQADTLEPTPPNIPSSFIRAAWMLQPSASVSPPRPPAVTSTPNAEESNQQPASHDLQTWTLPTAPLGLASHLRTQHLCLAPRKQEVARESQDQNARDYLLPRDFSHFQLQQKREALSQGQFIELGAGRPQAFSESHAALRTAQLEAA